MRTFGKSFEPRNVLYGGGGGGENPLEASAWMSALKEVLCGDALRCVSVRRPTIQLPSPMKPI